LTLVSGDEEDGMVQDVEKAAAAAADTDAITSMLTPIQKYLSLSLSLSLPTPLFLKYIYIKYIYQCLSLGSSC
jgi:hypothetical protein